MQCSHYDDIRVKLTDTIPIECWNIYSILHGTCSSRYHMKTNRQVQLAVQNFIMETQILVVACYINYCSIPRNYVPDRKQGKDLEWDIVPLSLSYYHDVSLLTIIYLTLW